MAVVSRKRKRWTTHYVVFHWQGRQIWEKVGRDRREAERIDRQRTKEVEDGTYHPDASAGGRFTLRQWFESWIAIRDVRSAKDEERWVRLHVLSRKRYADLMIDDAKPVDFDTLVRELKTQPRSAKDSRPLAHKSIGNVLGVLGVMFRDAHRAGHCPGNPINIAPGVLKASDVTKETYNPAEARVLISHETIPEGIRVLNALCLLGGLREGEACGRRWKDLDVEVLPLWCLDVATQYGGAPLKTDRPRVVPVHPELASTLERWARGGFELLTGRKPTPQDFIVPLVTPRAQTKHHTRSTYYKAFISGCKASGVRPRSLHSTRHTFITLCRRGGALKERVTQITHNPKGDIVDRYTHIDWEPLCEAVLKLRLDVDAHQVVQRTPGNRGNSGGPGRLLGTTNHRETPRIASAAPSSIPGASTLVQHKNSGTVEARQFARQQVEPPQSTENGRRREPPSAAVLRFRAQSAAWFRRAA